MWKAMVDLGCGERPYVCKGRYADRQSALVRVKALKQEGYDAFLLQEC